jgi:class 3 adenylate cyclase/tetratricopeptide (TPR) repeat protein
MARCPSCGQENPENAKFCLECGTPLVVDKSSTAEERKIVSILFVDLVGFTARSHAADPEDVRAALDPYHALLKREIERFGGTVEKFIGDAVMAVFGAPVAHEDDAERGVRTALRIVEAITELNEQDPSLSLSIRAAVNTGEGLVALGARPEAGEGMVTGDVVNTASRLQNVAPVNGVVVGQVTYRSTKQVIDYEVLEPVIVKGKPQPVPIWRAISARSRLGVDVESTPATPFVGRDFDLAVLKNAFQRSVKERSIQLVTVTGEPGVGKSRLLNEFRTYLDDSSAITQWRQGRCLPYGQGITFWALGEVVKAHSGILESDLPREATDKLAAAVAIVSDDSHDWDWLTTHLASLVGAQVQEGSDRPEQSESFAAWLRFLENVAETAPLVVVFEDVHWADPPLLDFIEHMVEWSTGSPLLIICTARPELFERHPSWAGGQRNSTTVSLAPLSDDETSEIITTLLSDAVLPIGLQATVLERAGGNPLYAEEFVRMLADQGILLSRDGAPAIADRAIPLPDSVQALIAARLDTLAIDRKSLLHDAAVVGKVFWAGAAASVGELDTTRVIQALHELVRKEFVRPARNSSIAGQEEYSFWHGLVRDVAYKQIPRREKYRRHRAVARWIEGMAGPRLADHVELLAHHYRQALALAESSGLKAEARELKPLTREFLELAGDRASKLDLGRAAEYYEEALQIYGPEESGRAVVLAKAGAMADGQGDPSKAVAAYEEAFLEYEKQGETLASGSVLRKLGGALWRQGDVSRSEQMFEKAIGVLSALPAGPELAEAYLSYGRASFIKGELTEALKWSEKGLALAQKLGVEELTLLGMEDTGYIRCALGEETGLEILVSLIDRCLDNGSAARSISLYATLSDAQFNLLGPRHSLKSSEEGIALARQRGLATYAIQGRTERLMMLYEAGRWDELMSEADDVIGSPLYYSSTLARSYKALTHLWRSQLQEAKSMDVLAPARKMKEPQVLAPALVVSALIDFKSGRSESAISFLEQFEEITRTTPWIRGLRVLDALRISLTLGASDLAETLVSGLNSLSARSSATRTAAHAYFAESSGSFEEALLNFQGAADQWAEFGYPLEQGMALLGAARCLLRLGRDQESSLKLQTARPLFESLQIDHRNLLDWGLSGPGG